MTAHGEKLRAMLRSASARVPLEAPAGTLRTRVNVLGAIALLTYLSVAVLSYPQAAALWYDADAPHTKAFFLALANALQPIVPVAKAWLVDHQLLDGAGMVVATVWLQLAVLSMVLLVLVVSLMRQGDRVDPVLPKLLLHWSMAFAAACALALPVFTQDFWLSAAWGRMAAAGANPYYTLFTPETLAGLQLDHFPMPMSYGPLWGIVSAGVMLAAGDSVLLAAVLFKAVLAGAWIGALYLVYRIMEDAPARERALAVAVLGWVPAGVGQSLAEGHNDIAMVAPALLWLFLLLRGRAQAPIALVASTMCKYATAPLLLIDLIHALRLQRLDWRRYVLRLVAPGLLGLATMAVFFRSLQFFDGLRLVDSWHFLQPRDAVEAIELTLGIWLRPLVLAATAVFPAFAAFALWTAWREPGTGSLLKATISLVAAILFAAISHFWPWYAVWGLAFAALLPTWWLSRFIIGVAVMAPFTLAAWWMEPFPNHRELAALAMYAGAIGWTYLTRERSPQAEPAAVGSERLEADAGRAPMAGSFALSTERTGTHG